MSGNKQAACIRHRKIAPIGFIGDSRQVDTRALLGWIQVNRMLLLSKTTMYYISQSN